MKYFIRFFTAKKPKTDWNRLIYRIDNLELRINQIINEVNSAIRKYENINRS